MSHASRGSGKPANAGDRLAQQIEFILELDELKRVKRRAYLFNEDRYENSAEHSWHVALMALVLAEHSDEPIDQGRVMKMLMLHDIVEIDAGDVVVFDTVARTAKAKQEARAADRLFGLLPTEIGGPFRALWEEFEAQVTAEARFAKAMDRLMPLLHNALGGARSWKELGVGEDQVRGINQVISLASQTLGAFMTRTVDEAVAQGLLPSQADSNFEESRRRKL